MSHRCWFHGELIGCVWSHDLNLGSLFSRLSRNEFNCEWADDYKFEVLRISKPLYCLT